MLRLKNIRKVFNEGTVNEKVALDGVTLTVEDGEFATIVGSNGAGKSTLFNCIGGKLFADEGAFIWMTATLPMCRSTSAQLRSGGSFRIR